MTPIDVTSVSWWVALAAGILIGAAATVVVGRWGRGPATPVPDRAAEARRHRQAVDINDDLVQGLVVARMAVEAGDTARVVAAIDRTLACARGIVGDLLEEPDQQPGGLIRHRASP